MCEGAGYRGNEEIRETPSKEDSRLSRAHITLFVNRFERTSAALQSPMGLPRSYNHSMNNSYHLVLECPKCHGNISLKSKTATPPSREEIACACEWKGRAAQTRLLRALPFNWIYSKAS